MLDILSTAVWSRYCYTVRCCLLGRGMKRPLLLLLLAVHAPCVHPSEPCCNAASLPVSMNTNKGGLLSEGFTMSAATKIRYIEVQLQKQRQE